MNVESLRSIEESISINQFSNASLMRVRINNAIVSNCCYATIAVCENNIIDTVCRICSDSTNNSAEIKGIRSALSLAHKYKNQYRYINIFSDSQISVFGLRDYIYRWKYNRKTQMLYNSMGAPVANQSIFIESHNILTDLILDRSVTVRILHQAGHISNSYKALDKAIEVFARSNNIRGSIDIRFIQYISTYNNYVDQLSRTNLRRSDHSKVYTDALEFYPKGTVNKFLQ